VREKVALLRLGSLGGVPAGTRPRCWPERGWGRGGAGGCVDHGPGRCGSGERVGIGGRRGRGGAHTLTATA
jgi:hypothetical protein